MMVVKMLALMSAFDGHWADQDALKAKALYTEHCGVCHQADGYGVPFMQPALIDSPKVLGSLDATLEMIFKGSGAIPEGSSDYDNLMPNFKALSDEDIALITTYIRPPFGSVGEPVAPRTVRDARKRFKTDD